MKTAFLSALAGLMMTPLAAFAEVVDYTDGIVKSALVQGRTVFVDYTTEWCSTCAKQKRIIAELKKKNPAYDEKILFVHVDWDDFASAPISTERNIPARSTLIALSGDQELGRILAGTRKADIKALLDAALEAAGG